MKLVFIINKMQLFILLIMIHYRVMSKNHISILFSDGGGKPTAHFFFLSLEWVSPFENDPEFNFQ